MICKHCDNNIPDKNIHIEEFNKVYMIHGHCKCHNITSYPILKVDVALILRHADKINKVEKIVASDSYMASKSRPVKISSKLAIDKRRPQLKRRRR